MVFKVIQVTNIPLQVTKDQMYTMFGCIGEIDDIRLYPTMRIIGSSCDSRICFIKYRYSTCAELAKFLTNTPLMDRALQVSPFNGAGEWEDIPSEQRGLEILAAERQKMDCNPVTLIRGCPPVSFEALCITLEENGLPPYPDLPVHYSRSVVEKIRRTLVVTNLNSSVHGGILVDYFSKAGDVNYVRLCQRMNDPSPYALVEFAKQESIILGLKLNDTEIMKNIKIKVYHSVQAIETKNNSEDINHSLSDLKSPQAPLEYTDDIFTVERSVMHWLAERQLSPSPDCKRSKLLHGDSVSSQDRKSRSKSSRRRSKSQERHSSGSRYSRKSMSQSRSKLESQEKGSSKKSKSRSSKSPKRTRLGSLLQDLPDLDKSGISKSHIRSRSRSQEQQHSPIGKSDSSRSPKRSKSRSRERRHSSSQKPDRSRLSRRPKSGSLEQHKSQYKNPRASRSPRRNRSRSKERGHYPRAHKSSRTCKRSRSGSQVTVHSQSHRPKTSSSQNRSRPRGRSRSQEKSGSQERSRSQEKSESQGRSRSHERPRSQERSRSQRRSRSQGRSRSRGRSWSQERSRSRGRSWSQERSRSQGRSRSQERSRSQGRSRYQERLGSQERSKSRERSRSQELSKHSKSRTSKSPRRKKILETSL